MQEDEIIIDNISSIFKKHSKDQDIDNNFSLLVKYYNSLGDGKIGYYKLKDLFKSGILQYYEKVNDNIISYEPLIITGSGELYIKIIIYLDLVNNFLEYINNRNDRNKTLYALFISYKDILSRLNGHDKNLLASKLENGIRLLNNVSQTIEDEVINNILEWKIGNIEYQLNQIDVEIESDRKKLARLVQEFGFSDEINQYLTDLNEININGKNNIEFAGIIGTYREFFGKMIESIGDKLSTIKKQGIPVYKVGQTKKGQYRRYIKEGFPLTDNEDKMIDNYVSILHDEGGHSMFSSKEYFRMTRNIGIEILYMLLSKLKSLS